MKSEPERRSAFATVASLFLFATVSLGTACLLSLLLSVGPAAEESWESRGMALPAVSRTALAASHVLSRSYAAAMAMVLGSHGILLIFLLWAGRHPGRLLWGTVVSCLLVATQLVLMLTLAIAFILPG